MSRVIEIDSSSFTLAGRIFCGVFLVLTLLPIPFLGQAEWYISTVYIIIESAIFLPALTWTAFGVRKTTIDTEDYLVLMDYRLLGFRVRKRKSLKCYQECVVEKKISKSGGSSTEGPAASSSHYNTILALTLVGQDEKLVLQETMIACGDKEEDVKVSFEKNVVALNLMIRESKKN